MKPNFSIRCAHECDAADILEIYAPFIRRTAVTFEYDVPDTAEFAERIRETAALCPYLVCEKDGEMVGYAYAHRVRERAAFDWDVELSIYLAPGARGHGVGTTVLACLIELLETQGFRHLQQPASPCRTKRALGCRKSSVLRTRACGTTPAGSSSAGTTSAGSKSTSVQVRRGRSSRSRSWTSRKYRNVYRNIRKS